MPASCRCWREANFVFICIHQLILSICCSTFIASRMRRTVVSLSGMAVVDAFACKFICALWLQSLPIWRRPDSGGGAEQIMTVVRLHAEMNKHLPVPNSCLANNNKSRRLIAHVQLPVKPTQLVHRTLQHIHNQVCCWQHCLTHKAALKLLQLPLCSSLGQALAHRLVLLPVRPLAGLAAIARSQRLGAS